MGWGLEIPDPDSGVKKTPGRGSATLTNRLVYIVVGIDLCVFVFMSSHLYHVVQSKRFFLPRRLIGFADNVCRSLLGAYPDEVHNFSFFKTNSYGIDLDFPFPLFIVLTSHFADRKPEQSGTSRADHPSVAHLLPEGDHA
jgi:hypothetical protein